jgi:hypothetical protein
MILGPSPAASETSLHMLSGVTIDGIFRQIAARQPDALALVDAPNRMAFTDGPQRRLTYAQADRMVDAIAARLRYIRLPADAVVAVQMPNTVEHVLTLLGVLRAGMIAAAVPQLWRRAQAISALSPLATRAFLTCSRLGSAGANHCQFAMNVAAEVFSIRCVGAFGHEVPDGVVPFDDLLAEKDAAPFVSERRDRAADHVAVMTFEIGPDGIVPVARSHSEMLAAGLAVMLESRLPQGARILSTIAPSSFGGIALTILPWLFCGGTLALHHPFDADTFAAQLGVEACDTLILPGALGLGLADALAGKPDTKVIAAWRAPVLMAASARWSAAGAELIDVPIFGEAALLPMRRGHDGWPNAIPHGVVTVPRGNPNGITILDLQRSVAGTLTVKGAMVPHHAFPPGIAASGRSHYLIGPDGAVDTRFPCRLEPEFDVLDITGPPEGIVEVGFYRFSANDLQAVCGGLGTGITLASEAHALLGRRLVGMTFGSSSDAAQLPAALAAAGVNPLIIAAFRDSEKRDTLQRAAASDRPATSPDVRQRRNNRSAPGPSRAQR